MSPPCQSHNDEYHVLNYFIDDEDSCALTAFINDKRFHVIAEKRKVNRGAVGQQYAKLLQAVKEATCDEGSLDTSKDSGIGLEEGDEAAEGGKQDVDGEETLQRWMLAPLENDVPEKAPKPKDGSRLTLEEWYDAPAYFYNLEVKDKVLSAIELEPDEDLLERLRQLRPEISIPKYVRAIDIPHYQAKDLRVLEGSDSPAPYHPTRVQLPDSETVLFFKPVDNGQPQPTKREISMLHKLAEKGLHEHEHMRCPKLEGLVISGEDSSKIMGFLQTDIEEPSPLTTKLDADVPQELRDRWAEEAERMKDVLHEHDMIWGDAKADNFIVDKSDNLWIIDFGGSYTEGWIDPEIKETKEGDDMGVVKITNALHDPVNNVWDPDTESSFGGSSSRKKRKADDLDGSDEVEEVGPATKSPKASRTSSGTTFCCCGGPS